MVDNMLEKNEKICVKTGEIHMEINSYLRLAFMFGNNQTQTFQSNLNKMIRLVLHELKMGDSLTVIDIIDQLQEQYGLAFSDNEVIEAIKNKQSKIVCIQ